jgi:hypothetical protein
LNSNKAFTLKSWVGNCQGLHYRSAVEGQERATITSFNYGNKSAEDKLAPYLKRRWRTSYEGKILEFDAGTAN